MLMFTVSLILLIIMILIVLDYNFEELGTIIAKSIIYIFIIIFYITSLLSFNKYKGLTSNKVLIPDYKIEYKIIDCMNKIDTTYYYYMKD